MSKPFRGEKLEAFKALGDAVSYDPETGGMTWLIASALWIKPGMKAGTLREGYNFIKFHGFNFAAADIAYFKQTGLIARTMDHINGVRNDDRWENLRECTFAENGQNKPVISSNTSGYPGVTWNTKAAKWVAQIQVNSKRIWLGHRDSKEEAYALYLEGKAKHHRFNPSVRGFGA